MLCTRLIMNIISQSWFNTPPLLGGGRERAVEGTARAEAGVLRSREIKVYKGIHVDSLLSLSSCYAPCWASRCAIHQYRHLAGNIQISI